MVSGGLLKQLATPPPPPVVLASVIVTSASNTARRFMTKMGITAIVMYTSSKVALERVTLPFWDLPISTKTFSRNDIAGLLNAIAKMALPTKCLSSNSVAAPTPSKAAPMPMMSTFLSWAASKVPVSPSMSPPWRLPCTAPTSLLPWLSGSSNSLQVLTKRWCRCEGCPRKTSR